MKVLEVNNGLVVMHCSHSHLPITHLPHSLGNFIVKEDMFDVLIFCTQLTRDIT